MSRRDRTMLIVLGAVVLLMLSMCCCLAILVPSYTYDAARDAASVEPATVRRVASRIANYDLPAGWQEGWSLDLAGFAAVSIRPGTAHGDVLLARLPFALNMPPLLRLGPQRGSQDGSRYVGSETYVIRGRQVEFADYEGTDQDGYATRTMTAVFPDGGGSILISITIRLREWDQQAVDQYIGSIR